jgi:hypothetical protein
MAETTAVGREQGGQGSTQHYLSNNTQSDLDERTSHAGHTCEGETITQDPTAPA